MRGMGIVQSDLTEKKIRSEKKAAGVVLLRKFR